jgi:glycine cleavage system H protein
MSRPKNYKYSKEHEWIDLSDSKVGIIGVTDYAVEQLGDIVHIDLPSVGTSFKIGDAFGTIESTKTVSDLYMPMSGKVVAVNDSIKKSPESLSSDSFKNGWLVKIELQNGEETVKLMDEVGYEKFINQ